MRRRMIRARQWLKRIAGLKVRRLVWRPQKRELYMLFTCKSEGVGLTSPVRSRRFWEEALDELVAVDYGIGTFSCEVKDVLRVETGEGPEGDDEASVVVHAESGSYDQERVFVDPMPLLLKFVGLIQKYDEEIEIPIGGQARAAL